VDKSKIITIDVKSTKVIWTQQLDHHVQGISIID